MKQIIIAIFLILLTLPVLAGEWTQYYFKFQVKDSSELQNLTKVISIDNVRGKTVWAYANDREWAEFISMGYAAEVLPSPASQFAPVMRDAGQTTRLWDTYPTYDAYVAQMYAFATSYPSLCQIVDAGTTVNGRKILFAKISDNIGTHEKEPEVMYTSTIHGDEATGFVLMLRLIDTLLSQYGTNPRITNLVNNMEIWINPNANPDGTYYGGNSTVSGARRANYNGYDLNRNFPNYNGSTNTGPFQTETNIMTTLANAHHFVYSFNIHGGAEVVNFPWDYTYTLHPDDSWYYTNSLVYASSVQANGPTGYFTGISSNGVTNGADWYVIAGGRQDWMNYTAKCREVTIEISNTKLPAAATLPNYWNYNYDAFLSYLEQVMYGIHGTVVDAYGTPLNATITVLSHDNDYSKVITDPAHGNFYRWLSPGNYTLQVETAGYTAKTVNVTVTAGQQTPVTVVFGQILPTQNISLSTGWNLISLNVLPVDLSVSSVLSGISGSLLQIKDAEFTYAPAMAVYFNTMSNLSVGKGYWVNMSAPATLSVTGTAINPSLTGISLNPGWNLVAYLPASNSSVSTALTSISTYLQEVRSLTQVYIPGAGGNTLSIMTPNSGYWIKVSQACTLTYPGAAK